MAYKKTDFKTPVGKLRFWQGPRQYGIFFDVSKNIGCETTLYLSLAPRLAFNMTLTTKCDHAGFNLDIDIFGLELEIKIYDGRHWNAKANRYYLPGEEQAEIDAEDGTND